MNLIDDVFNQLLKNRRYIYLGLFCWVGLVCFVLAIHLSQNVHVGNLTRDPNVIGGISAYSGFLSQIGIFFWSSAATLCLIGSLASMIGNQIKPVYLFWILSGLLSLILGFDDTFMLHEAVFPRLGIPEKVVLVSYFLLVTIYLVMYKEQLIKTNFVILFFALSFFGCSVVIDVVDPDGEYRVLFEDGFKTGGQIFWLLYFYISLRSQLIILRGNKMA